MSAVTFDTHKFVKKLEASGFAPQQAETLIEFIQEANSDSELTTKRDLKEFELRTQAEFALVRAEMSLLKWMLGVVLGLAVANFAKQFF